MKFYSKDNKAIKIYHLLHVFFESISWDDKKAGLYFEDGLFVFEEKDIRIETSDNYMREIYDALAQHFQPISRWGIVSGVRPLKIVHEEKEAGKTDEEIFQGLTERDRISPDKARLLLEISKNQEILYKADRDKLSLYISIPFCPSICSYCCFHTRVYRENLADDYMKRLLDDLVYAKEQIKKHDKEVDCIYIGGGTPWVLEVDQMDQLFSSLKDLGPLKEFTFEGGRLDSLTQAKADLVASQVNRVCLNPQTLSPGITPLLGRPEAQDLDYWIKFFQDKDILVASDLIAGLPGENLESFGSSLKELISYKPDNITIHNLSLKRGAKLTQVQPGNSVASMLDKGYNLLKEASYKPYYIYRQKNMLERGENVGYELGETASIYNIRMMEDSHEILSLGSNAVSKKIKEGQLKRITSPRDLSLYIREEKRNKELIDEFFK